MKVAAPPAEDAAQPHERPNQGAPGRRPKFLRLRLRLRASDGERRARREEPKKPGPGEARRGEPRAHDQHRGRLLSAGRRLGLSVRRGTACYLGARAGGGSLRRAFPRAGHAFEPSRSRARTGQSKGTLQSEARGAGGADLPRRLHVPPHQPISQLCPACFICKISGRPKMGWVHRCGLPGQRHAVCRTNISGYAQRARTDVPLDREVST